MRVVIADDHALVRQGLVRLLRAEHPGWDFAEAGTLDQALDIVEAPATDLLIVDLGMPGMAGGTSLQSVRAVYPAMKVAVLTGTDARDTILECLAAGVHGYILKSGASDDLLHAVERIMAGGVYVPAMLTDIVQAERSHRAAAPPAINPMPAPHAAETPGHLTPRQADVLALLAEGRSTKDIARTLNLGVGTVKVHLAGVYRALGAQNRMEAVVKAGRFNHRA